LQKIFDLYNEHLTFRESYMAVSKTLQKIAPTTKKLYRELAKGKELTQAQVGKMMWKTLHKNEEEPEYIHSYWHSSLLGHVEKRRVSKKRVDGKVVYRLTQTGRRFAVREGIIKE
jgi:hypothetical protein